MRSNIARTWPASSVPACAPTGAPARGRAATAVLLELREEVDDRRELLRREVLEGGHRRRRVDERSRDRLAGQARADLRQVGPRAGVAVLADLVAGEAAGLGDDELARFI